MDGCVRGFGVGCDAGGLCAFCDMIGLTETQPGGFLDDVDAEEGFEIVGFRYGLFLFENMSEIGDECLMTGCDGKVIDTFAEIYASDVRAESKEKAWIVCGTAVSLCDKGFC